MFVFFILVFSYIASLFFYIICTYHILYFHIPLLYCLLPPYHQYLISQLKKAEKQKMLLAKEFLKNYYLTTTLD